MASRLLFLCAQRSGRALLAASLLHSTSRTRFDIWSSPAQDAQESALVERILNEQGVTLLASDHLIQPTFGLRWDEGIILCSGLAATWPIIPGAGRHRLWTVEDAPDPTVPLEERLAAYRRILDALLAQIALEFRLHGRMLAVVPQHKWVIRWHKEHPWRAQAMETEPQREQMAEIPLPGGQLTPGVMRIGNTVRRPPKGNMAFVHNLLLFLEEQGFPFAPRFWGMDEQGREILSYLEGQTWPDSGSQLSDDLLVQAAQAIRQYHDLTTCSQLSQDHEIVAHNELGPHNTIFQDGHLVGFIDWDDAAPGTRLRDLSNAIYNYVDVSHWSNQSAGEQARRVHLICAAYGWDDPLAIINDFEADLQQALRNHEQAGSTGAIKIFAEEVDWMHQRAQELRLAFCD